jgi:Zn-finger nucleic acid-binding protein
VRLVACPDCHAQYDVTQVTAPRFPCRCGSVLENRPPAPVDAAILRCASCGALADAEAERCSFCGSTIVRDPGNLSLICPECFARTQEDARFCTACGVAFRPEPVRLEGYELPCPACGALMPPRQLAGIALNECTHCHGLWVPRDGFDALVQRALEARQKGAVQGAAHAPPRVDRGNPTAQRVQYRKCPECQALMQRRNFRHSSGVIIDTCAEHGTWLDADELEQIAGFLASGRAPSPLLATPEPARLPPRAAEALARLEIQRERLRGRAARGHEGSGVGSLLDVLTRLLT